MDIMDLLNGMRSGGELIPQPTSTAMTIIKIPRKDKADELFVAIRTENTNNESLTAFYNAPSLLNAINSLFQVADGMVKEALESDIILNDESNLQKFFKQLHDEDGYDSLHPSLAAWCEQNNLFLKPETTEA